MSWTLSDPDQVAHIYSSVQVSHRLKTLLDLGINFASPSYKNKFYNYHYYLKKLVKDVQDEPYRDFYFALCELKYISLKFFHKFNPCKVFSPVFSMSDIKLLRNFASSKSIVLKIPDKRYEVFV